MDIRAAEESYLDSNFPSNESWPDCVIDSGSYQNLKGELVNLGLSAEFGLVDGRAYIIGRTGDIQIDSPSVSKRHAEMIVKNRRIYLRDLKSTNGIFLIIDKRLVRFKEGYVSHDQPIMIGKEKCTLRSLLSTNFGKTDSNPASAPPTLQLKL